MSDLAMAFELALGPMNNERLLEAGIGVPLLGVHTQQSVTDLWTMQALLYRVKPDLLIEIGTMCGGSALFFARTMMGYNPNATVITFDANTNNNDRLRRCDNFHKAMSGTRKLAGSDAVQGLHHPSWKALHASGNLKFVAGTATKPKHQLLLEKYAARATSVFVVDDGSHMKEHVLEQWQALSRFVTPGSYYVVQDTRLDTDCAHAVLKGKGGWCRETREKGGPARGVAAIVTNASYGFAQNWEQDRTVEAWGITQHPGGYLLRLQGVKGGGRSDAR